MVTETVYLKPKVDGICFSKEDSIIGITAGGYSLVVEWVELKCR